MSPSRWFCAMVLWGVGARLLLAQAPPPPGAIAPLPEPSLIKIKDQPFFPVGLYHYPKQATRGDIFAEMAEQGFNLYLLPAREATQERLDAARKVGVQVMVVVTDLMNLSGTPEQIDAKKKDLERLIGKESVIFKHPAVIALEGPDEPLWNVKGVQRERDGVPQDLAAWVRTEAQAAEIDKLLIGLRDGYAEIRRLAGDRYAVWINFAPRGDERELRWFTELPAVGGFGQDGRTTADVFGTDVYPAPGGGGSNGWINGRLVPSEACVGAFAEKLQRAVHPHPLYMVLQGCGIQEWDAQAVAEGRDRRRPTFDELQFMAFDAIVHGARGILMWGPHYISDDSLYWRQMGRVNRQVRALAPLFTAGTPWPEALPGDQQVCVIGRIHAEGRYVLAVNEDPAHAAAGWIAVPGWSGGVAYSLLHGREVAVKDGVIRDSLPPLSVRVYADSPALFAALQYCKPEVLAKRPMRLLFGLPLEEEPFAGKLPPQVAELLKASGVDGVVQMPHDAKLVDALHKAGIKAFAEISCFSGKAAWDKFPGTRPVTAEGVPFESEGDYGGLCVNQEEYVRDLLGRIDHLLGEAKWDGLWLDYIRWPGRWEEETPALTELCFCDVCLKRFAEDRGVHYDAELADTKAKAAWILAHHRPAWIAWKCDRVTDVVSRVRRLMKAKLGDDAVLGIFGVPMREADFDGAIQRTFGQDWSRLGSVVDVFSPMVYHIYCGKSLEWIGQVNAEVAARSGRTVWPIVQSCSVPAEMSAEEFERALHAGLGSPSRGIMVFSTTHTLKERKWDTMVKVYREAGPSAK